jgi:hypothetical protein
MKIGVKAIATLKGEARANAMMTAETKGKRRVTLSICGLGVLDETEVADLPPQAVQIPPPAPIPHPEPPPPPPPTAEAEDDPNLPALPPGTVRILQVTTAETKTAGVLRHSVMLSTGEEMTTIKPWIATLARKAYEEQRPVRITSQATKFGTQIPRLRPATAARRRCPPPTIPFW